MTNKTKKMLSILASTAVLAGFTADIALNSNPTTVNAAKKQKKKVKKTKKAAKQTADSGTTSKSKYSSLGAWYLANDKYLYGRYNGQGYFADGNYYGGSTPYVIVASKVDNDYYKYGWIIGYVNGGSTMPTDSELYGINADKYNQAIDIYNSGVNFLKSSSGVQKAQYDPTSNAWSVRN